LGLRSDNNASERTEVIYGSDNVMSTILQFLSNTNTISSCGDRKAPFMVFESEEYKKLLFDIKKRGIEVRYITDITKENITYCEELMDFGFEIRHLDGIKANFSVSELEYLASTSLIGKHVQEEEEEQLMQKPIVPIQQLIYSNVKDIVEQQKYVFESFWNKAIPAERRISEIEQGFVLGSTEIIQIPSRTKELFIDLVKLAKEEVLLFLPTANAFVREERIGIIELLKEAATKREPKVSVRIITPINSVVEKMVQNMLTGQQPNNLLDIQYSHVTTTTTSPSESNLNTVTILVVDKKAFL
jgi:two-component system, OmpR family, sensor histidine kinase VicK